MNRLARLRSRPVLLTYVALLVLSNAVRLIDPVDGTPSPQQQTLTLAAIDRGKPADKTVRLAYRDEGPRDAPVVLLLHGTPVAGNAVAPLGRELGRYRLLIPDLPGFGGSTLGIPDYSFSAHASYLREMLDRLDIGDVHVVGYSQGGGVALSLAEMAPERVRSLTMLSAIGVQELELLGDYRLNRGLYAAQLWFVRALTWLVPHFGYLDDAVFNTSYARNFYDSDQRPLREILGRFEAPMLIVHGRDDKLVPLAAALEHHRIVPQSELALYDSGHMVVFSEPFKFAPEIVGFLERVDSDTATFRRNADPARLQQARESFDWRQVPGFTGLTLFIVLFLLAVSTYVSEDLACITAGLMVARGMFDFMPATLACLAGIYTGDLLLYYIGRKLGPEVLDRRPFKWFIDESKLQRSRAWFERRGPFVIVLSRFLPGTRLPTYVVAGLLKMSVLRFSFYFLLASIIWTPILVGGAYLAGARVLEYLQSYQQYSIPVVIALLLLLWLTVTVVVPLFSYRGRRLLLSSWRRKTRWEFWPRWVFYPPLFLYVVYLGLRYRGLTLFTASNPAIPAGGFIGESKSAILDGLSAAGDRVARYAKVEPGTPSQRQICIERFISEYDLKYPIVVKPDVGERGNGVLIADNIAAVREYLAEMKQRLIVQEFAPGHEYGVFYYRIPGEQTGRIFAVTDKRPVTVTGDGRSTLEKLILADDRAVCMADTFLNRHAGRLFDVPAGGRIVTLVDVGTHCMGCLFLDGGDIVTPELETEIDRISQVCDGFYFGRYDIRTPDVEAFRRGDNYKVVELNGVTSEATNIYDPRNSLWQAYRVLMQQWRLAFRIGAANRERGVEPVSLRELLRLLVTARRNETGNFVDSRDSPVRSGD